MSLPGLRDPVGDVVVAGLTVQRDVEFDGSADALLVVLDASVDDCLIAANDASSSNSSRISATSLSE